MVGGHEGNAGAAEVSVHDEQGQRSGTEEAALLVEDRVNPGVGRAEQERRVETVLAVHEAREHLLLAGRVEVVGLAAAGRLGAMDPVVVQRGPAPVGRAEALRHEDAERAVRELAADEVPPPVGGNDELARDEVRKRGAHRLPTDAQARNEFPLGRYFFPGGEFPRAERLLEGPRQPTVKREGRGRCQPCVEMVPKVHGVARDRK